MKFNLKETLNFKQFVVLLTGMFFVAAAVYYIMLPSEFVVGGISGLTVVLANYVPLNISTITMILNVALLIVGFIFVGEEFGIKTVITSLLLPAYLKIFEIVTPDIDELTGDLFVNVVCFVLLLSFGQAMLFNVNASSGGLDIVGKIMNKYLHVEIGKALAIAGFVIAASSILVYTKEILVLSLLGTYLNGKVIDSFIEGFHIRKRVTIISKEQDKIERFIIDKLNRGVTLFPAEGGYDHEKRTEMVTILQTNEYGKLLEFVQKTDPKAFVTVSTTGQVIGQWNPHKRKID